MTKDHNCFCSSFTKMTNYIFPAMITQPKEQQQQQHFILVANFLGQTYKLISLKLPTQQNTQRND